MGRSKAKPVRQVATTTFLGRVTLAATEEERRDRVQAAWIQEQLVVQDKTEESSSLALDDGDDDSDDDILLEIARHAASDDKNTTTVSHSRHGKRRVIEESSDDEEIETDQGKVDRGKQPARKALRSTLQSPNTKDHPKVSFSSEPEENEPFSSFTKTASPRKRSPPNRTSTTSRANKSAVALPSHENKNIWRLTEDNEGFILFYKASADEPPTNPFYTVYSHKDPCSLQVEPEVGENANAKWPPQLQVSSPEVIRQILSCLIIKDVPLQILDQCCSDGCIVLLLKAGHANGAAVWNVSVALTERALQVSTPQALPLPRRKSKRYETANAIHLLLAALYPASILSETSRTLSTDLPLTFLTPPKDDKSKQTPPLITARRVYECTDNQQLQRVWGTRLAELPNVIPNLNPTLRGYQKAAVAWMLRREQGDASTRDDGKEWYLGWYVLDGDGITPLTGYAAVPTKTNASVLYFCPFASWMANSLEKARDIMTPEQMTIKGGILAESMGLGKTVEVLACILANPRPGPSPSARLRLDFNESVQLVSIVHEASIKGIFGKVDKGTSANVGIVGDLSEFADDESEDEDSSFSDTPLTSTKHDLNHPRSNISVPVTPDSTNDDVPPKVRWVEEDNPIGSCICGNLIHLNDLSKHVVICPTCDEPMHMECAAFTSLQAMTRETKPLEYRLMFTDEKWQCRLGRNDEICPCCLSDKKEVFDSRATLIVTPPAILGQWEREIKRHVKSLKFSVAIYDGVDKICKLYGPRKDGLARKFQSLHPKKLAENDIILMTFDVLMSDLGHSDKNKYLSGEANTNLRKRKRYRVVPSPLTMIRFWRICLDEAQRVERPTAASAQMAMKLEAENRWCVTGTPVGRGKLEDLFGLLLFLRMDPFSFRPFFNCCMSSAHSGVDGRIQHLLSNIFWRSTKKNDLVREQIGIPDQVEKKVVLRFSSIERHFYERQFEQTLRTAGDVADRAKSGKKRTTKQLNLLAEHLHSLRAACCHPQVGSSGIGKGRRGAVCRKRDEDAGNDSVASRVLTMDEILIRFIEDAKLKCEEAQRLAVLHTNGMAAVSRLKVEARGRGVSFKETDEQLLVQSCRHYLESLELTESNAKPTTVLGSAVISGSTGFLSPLARIEGGSCDLEWKMQTGLSADVWSKIEFDGHSRRLTLVQVRPIITVPEGITSETSDEIEWIVLTPRKCVLQVSSAAVGGEFVDVVEIEFDSKSNETDELAWFSSENFRTHKSKSWRLVAKDLRPLNRARVTENTRHYIGLKVQMNEADIAFDPLQRLHCLHNAGLAFTSLLQSRTANPAKDRETSSVDVFLSESEMGAKIEKMRCDANIIESLYMEVARSLHRECSRRLKESVMARKQVEEELEGLQKRKLADCFEDGWWDDFLAISHLYGGDIQKQQLFDRVTEDLDMLHGGSERGLIRFPPFRDIHGLRVALQSRVRDIRRGIGKPTSWLGTVDEATTTYQFREDRFRYSLRGFAKCMDTICGLSSNPTDHDVFENSHCRVCKADWNQKGPQCRHCRIGDTLNELEVDRVTLLVLTSIHNVLRSAVGHSLLSSSREAASIEERAAKFFEVLEAHKKEKVNAWRMWRSHLDLMNDIDELNQCKASMRLAGEDEDITVLTDDQLNAVVIPQDLQPRFLDHQVKQAMAFGDLRRAKDTLRFLRNQTLEHSDKHGKKDSKQEENCMVCLSAFDDGNRAVLRCGHSFHQTPCIDKLIQPGTREVRCPCRCRMRTREEEVMIASDQRRDDGSRSKREVKGSWGTKVTRLVADLLDLRDTGEKGIVFSQWEDMLDIVEEALSINNLKHVRAQSMSKIGQATKAFRIPDCTVLLLNVKNGAEGLTLLEATHVFMVEPLLNHGLDIQAISRIHRIGQTNKTYVHRYLMEGSVEEKIDTLRMQHQEDILEDALLEAKTSELRAGGIDGGFHSEAEVMDLLKIDD